MPKLLEKYVYRGREGERLINIDKEDVKF